MATIEQLTAQAHKLPPSTPLHEQVAKYSGNPHQLLLALLKNPDKPILSILEEIGCAIGSYYRWRGSLEDYAATVDAIREGKESLRRTAALAILEARTIPIAEAMANRAEGMGRDAQRAGERILETVGVLRKDNDQAAQAPVPVVTYTYVLVQPGQEPKTIMVETTAKELPPASDAPARLRQGALESDAHKTPDGKGCREK